MPRIRNQDSAASARSGDVRDGADAAAHCWPVPAPDGLPRAHARNTLRSYRYFRLLGCAAAPDSGAEQAAAAEGGSVVRCAGEWELYGNLLEDPVQLRASRS